MKARAKLTSDADPLLEEDLQQIEKIIKKYMLVYIFYLLISHSFIREDGVVLTQVPRLFGPLRKSAYQQSPLKYMFGSDGVDKFDDSEDDEEGSSVGSR